MNSRLANLIENFNTDVKSILKPIFSSQIIKYTNTTEHDVVLVSKVNGTTFYQIVTPSSSVKTFKKYEIVSLEKIVITNADIKNQNILDMMVRYCKSNELPDCVQLHNIIGRQKEILLLQNSLNSMKISN